MTALCPKAFATECPVMGRSMRHIAANWDMVHCNIQTCSGAMLSVTFAIALAGELAWVLQI